MKWLWDTVLHYTLLVLYLSNPCQYNNTPSYYICPQYSSFSTIFQLNVCIFKYFLFIIIPSWKGLPLPPFQHPQLCIWALNQNSATPILFVSSNPIQNGMTRHGSIPVAKGLGAGQGLPHRDWAGVLPTQKLPATNLATPKSFIAID